MKRLFFFLLLGLMPLAAWAVRPMASAHMALVAGDGAAGFRDGDFTSAFFNKPLSLAASTDGTRLFVADSANHRIRVIHLDQDNEVSTLVGQDSPGKQDGPLDKARFNQPRGVLYLPGERLVVNDWGNKLLRLVDLKAGTVTTLEGKEAPATADAAPATNSANAPSTAATKAAPTPVPAKPVSMVGIRDMAYLAALDLVFFTQPDNGTLKSLDLKTGLVTTVLDKKEGLPHPTALGVAGDKLYVADREAPQVFSVDWKPGAAANIIPIAKTPTQVMALAGNKTYLYAILWGAQPLQRLLPTNESVTFESVWGDVIKDPGANLFTVYDPEANNPLCLASDPLDERKLYIANPFFNVVTSFRDLLGGRIAGDTVGSEYPAAKPPRTFRILLLGDSRSAEIINFQFRPMLFPSGAVPRQLNVPSKLQLELNTQAALEGVRTNFEVVAQPRSADQNLFLWPAYEAPDLIKQNDIDLVLIMYPITSFTQFPFNCYYTHPMTKEGIPARNVDPEYVLKPPSQRIPDGEPRRFYDLCKARKLVEIKGNNIVFSDKLKREQYGMTISKQTEPELYDSVVNLMGKPLDILNKKLAGLKTAAGGPVRLLLVFTPTGTFRPCPEDEEIWAGAAQRFHIPFLDLSPEMKTLRLAYFPLAENGGNDHFDIHGHLFFGQILAHVLIRDGLVPWEKTAPPVGKH